LRRAYRLLLIQDSWVKKINYLKPPKNCQKAYRSGPSSGFEFSRAFKHSPFPADKQIFCIAFNLALPFGNLNPIQARQRAAARLQVTDWN
jgi:hypothetical protein